MCLSSGIDDVAGTSLVAIARARQGREGRRFWLGRAWQQWRQTMAAADPLYVWKRGRGGRGVEGSLWMRVWLWMVWVVQSVGGVA